MKNPTLPADDHTDGAIIGAGDVTQAEAQYVLDYDRDQVGGPLPPALRVELFRMWTAPPRNYTLRLSQP